jgi:hypothetical protein
MRLARSLVVSGRWWRSRFSARRIVIGMGAAAMKYLDGSILHGRDFIHMHQGDCFIGRFARVAVEFNTAATLVQANHAHHFGIFGGQVGDQVNGLTGVLRLKATISDHDIHQRNFGRARWLLNTVVLHDCESLHVFAFCGVCFFIFGGLSAGKFTKINNREIWANSFGACGTWLNAAKLGTGP